MQYLWSRSPFPSEFAPSGDLHETDETFTVELDLPGVNKAGLPQMIGTRSPEYGR